MFETTNQIWIYIYIWPTYRLVLHGFTHKDILHGGSAWVAQDLKT